ncbi:molybdopterin-dependent oxidoreductase [Desulfosporosinus shakirovi]|uniref:molybdopterin-dependent oxidoreductase n=1 Tax=Desulfosporosinus shakirovi TaxID=2885154 RepID=UPI001E52D87E|nr:molybdopterin-dependent oxidoreductase [Desulfosporosinus sp. SRJS8]MCB8814984.1 molybdopterin-dependent oxidoreductase [Desulfosporosinus sp. SRJS8]
MLSDVKVFKNVCPRNCYNTCAMLSYVVDGKLIKVEGDPSHGYCQGRLCGKGYAYTRYVYSPKRLRYPLKQYPRGSGNWVRITWEEAFNLISAKLLELNHRYGSNRSLAYNKCSGNVGILHYATEGMFNSFGSHTKLRGNPCMSAGMDAVEYSSGEGRSPDPEAMTNSKLIVIWGANPAWTAVHQLNFINQARDKGAVLVVIDPVYTATAATADHYIQVRPGTDGLLALGIAKVLVEEGRYDSSFVKEHVVGWESFYKYLQEKVSLEEVQRLTGVAENVLQLLADLYSQNDPATNWCGYGLQRHQNGGQNVRAIYTLSALTGNVGKIGGDFYYFHPSTDFFPMNLLNLQGPDDGQVSRALDINNYPSQALSLVDPPMKFLWIAARNPLSQDQEVQDWTRLLKELEMVVTVDLFMTKTAEASDIVLPATSHFEDFDINVSYWHHWLALNQKAIEPYYEAKSDLEIAKELTRRLNELQPGFSNFPSERTAEEWIESEFTSEILRLYGLSSWRDLEEVPAKLQFGNNPWLDLNFKTNTGKFEIFSKNAKDDKLPALPRFWAESSDLSFPLRMLTPQNITSIHSQNWALEWIGSDKRGNVVTLNPQDAVQRKVEDGDLVRIYNAQGSVTRKARLNPEVLQGMVIIYQGGKEPVNSLLSGLSADMGKKHSGSEGAALYNAFVEVEKIVRSQI